LIQEDQVQIEFGEEELENWSEIGIGNSARKMKKE